MADFNKSIDLGKAFNSMVEDVIKISKEAKKEGQAAGESIGVGFDDGLDTTIQKIQASSIKIEKAFKNLSEKIKKQSQQLTTNINGKNAKIKIDFSNIDINTDDIKKNIEKKIRGIKNSNKIEFDIDIDNQLTKIATLFVKYQEKLNSLQKAYPSISAPQDAQNNLKQQLALATEMKRIHDLLNKPVALFSFDADPQAILKTLSQIQQFSNVDTSKSVGEYDELAKVLKEIQGSLQIISDTFKNESNAMKSMADGGVTSFESLSQAIIGVYNNLTQVQNIVDAISKKDFNITNITQTGGGSNNLQAMTQQMAVARETMEHLRKLYDQAQETLQGLGSKGEVGLVFEYAKQLQELNLSDIGKSVKGANTEMKLASVIAEMQDYIDKLIQINELRNKFNLGEWKDTFVSTQNPTAKPVVQPKTKETAAPAITQSQNTAATANAEAQQMWKLKAAIDEVSNAIGRKNSGFVKEKEIVDASVNAEEAKLRELVGVITTEIGNTLDSIKVKFAQSFSIPEINKSGLKESLDAVYKEFVGLKDKISDMKIDIGVNTAGTDTVTGSASNSQQAVEGESQSAVDASKSFVDAANAKKEFVEANKQVAESAKTSEGAVKKEAEAAKQVATNVSNSVAKVDKDLAKTKDIFNNDGELIQTDVTKKYKTDKAVVTETDSTRITRDKEGNEATSTITTIVNDFEKLTKETKKSEEAVARAQKKLDEFLARFQSKSGGNAKFISGFSDLEGTKVTSDNIEDVFNKMIKLQEEYSKLETNFRKGQSSLNPFVNAITKSENIGNIFSDVERQFNSLTTKSDELVNNFTKLQDLTQKIQAFTKLMNSSPDAITPEAFSEFSKQVGEFNVLKSQVEGSIKAQSIIDADAEKKRVKEVENYINLIKQKNEYEAKAAKGGNMRSVYEAKVAEIQERIAANDKSSIMNQEEQNRLLAMEEAHLLKIAEIKQKDADKQLFNKQNDKLQDKFNAGYLSEANFSKWQKELETYKSYLDGTVAADKATVDKKKASLTQLYDHLNKISNASRTFFASGGEILPTWLDSKQIKNVSNSLHGLYNTIVAERFDGMKTSVTGVNETLGRLTFTVDDGKGALSQYTIAMDKASGATKLLSGNTKEALTKVQQFGKALKTDVRGIFSAFIGGMSGMYAVGRYFKEGIQVVRELDKALTELKKVTDETEETYNKFLETAGKTGTRIGRTVTDVVSATAEFAKLGYDVNTAASMAESALIYANVGDGVDVETGSQSIISTMKAFGVEADNTMSIVDKFNEVGNNFAITTKGIGDALQVSASAMAAAGNSLDETIALTTAANTIVQNPNTVGKMLCRH